jgi:hypothetical protein
MCVLQDLLLILILILHHLLLFLHHLIPRAAFHFVCTVQMRALFLWFYLVSGSISSLVLSDRWFYPIFFYPSV